MKSLVSRSLAAAAVRERDARVKHYPAMITAGKLSEEEARFDIDAWRAIAELFEAGETRSEMGWGELALATARALRRREEACEEKPESSDLAARRDLVFAIHRRISDRHDFFVQLNADLRARVEPDPAARAKAAA